MADRSCGEIQVGGRMPRRLVPVFIAHLKEHGLVDDFVDDETYLKHNMDVDGVLSFEDNETPGGAFYELEQFLKKNKLDFDRQASPSYYYDPENVSWRNGECWESSRDATDALRERIVKELDEIMNSLGRSDDAQEKLFYAFIRRNGPPPELRPFTIVEE